MWTALASAADGLDAPPVPWDALWAKRASDKHHEVRRAADRSPARFGAQSSGCAEQAPIVL